MAGQRVDQARLADVRSTDDGDLGQRRRREVLRRGRGDDEGGARAVLAAAHDAFTSRSGGPAPPGRTACADVARAWHCAAQRRARLGRRQLGEAEGARDRRVAHEVVLGVGRPGAVAGLAADLDGDRRARRAPRRCAWHARQRRLGPSPGTDRGSARGGSPARPRAARGGTSRTRRCPVQSRRAASATVAQATSASATSRRPRSDGDACAGRLPRSPGPGGLERAEAYGPPRVVRTARGGARDRTDRWDRVGEEHGGADARRARRGGRRRRSARAPGRRAGPAGARRAGRAVRRRDPHRPTASSIASGSARSRSPIRRRARTSGGSRIRGSPPRAPRRSRRGPTPARSVVFYEAALLVENRAHLGLAGLIVVAALARGPARAAGRARRPRRRGGGRADRRAGPARRQARRRDLGDRERTAIAPRSSAEVDARGRRDRAAVRADPRPARRGDRRRPPAGAPARAAASRWSPATPRSPRSG